MESYFKLYLAIDYQYRDKLICQTLEQVEYELNKAVGYNRYIVIEHNNINDSDQIVAVGEIEVNRKGRKR